MSIPAVYDFDHAKRWSVHVVHQHLGKPASVHYPYLILQILIKIPQAELMGTVGAFECTSLIVECNNLIRFDNSDETPDKIQAFPLKQNVQTGEYCFELFFRDITLTDRFATGNKNAGKGMTFQPKYGEYTLKQQPGMNWTFAMKIKSQ